MTGFLGWLFGQLVACVRETVVDVKKPITTGQLLAQFEPRGCQKDDIGQAELEPCG